MLSRVLQLAVLFVATSVVFAPMLRAQVVLGSLKDSASTSPVVGATITLVDSTGATVAEARSAADGRFTLDAKRVPKLRFSVRKIGVAPTLSGYFDIAEDADSLSVELLAPVTGVTLATVTVTAVAMKPNFNTGQLAEARRFGWRVIEPHVIAQDRTKAVQFSDLLRRNPIAGIRMPRRDGECFTSSRSNRCLDIVVDGQVLGPIAFINPEDVYFIAFMNAQQSQVAYGPRAPQGAIFIATRRRGDDERKPTTPPRF